MIFCQPHTLTQSIYSRHYTELKSSTIVTLLQLQISYFIRGDIIRFHPLTEDSNIIMPIAMPLPSLLATATGITGSAWASGKFNAKLIWKTTHNDQQASSLLYLSPVSQPLFNSKHPPAQLYGRNSLIAASPLCPSLS